MRQLITILSIFIFFSGQSFAQGSNYHKKREEIKKKKYEFVNEKLQLTEKETKEFMPLYQEFDNKRDKLFDSKRQNMRNFKKNSLNMDNKELTVLIDKFIEIDIQLAELGKIYYNKFKKVLSPMKIILLQHSENEFKKHLLRGAHGRGGPSK